MFKRFCYVLFGSSAMAWCCLLTWTIYLFKCWKRSWHSWRRRTSKRSRVCWHSAWCSTSMQGCECLPLSASARSTGKGGFRRLCGQALVTTPSEFLSHSSRKPVCLNLKIEPKNCMYAIDFKTWQLRNTLKNFSVRSCLKLATSSRKRNCVLPSSLTLALLQVSSFTVHTHVFSHLVWHRPCDALAAKCLDSVIFEYISHMHMIERKRDTWNIHSCLQSQADSVRNQ